MSLTCATRASAAWSRSCPTAGGPPAARATDRAIAIAEGTRLFTLAESLGGVESLIEVPAAMTHLSVAGSPLEVDPALVRLSVGIEGIDDLLADLARALDRSLTSPRHQISRYRGKFVAPAAIALAGEVGADRAPQRSSAPSR